MLARFGALIIWLLVAASAAGWALHASRSGTPLPSGTAVARIAPPATGDLGAFLGQAPTVAAAPAVAAPEPADDGRFSLVGVVAGGTAGVAVISAEGKPARTVRVGGEVEPGLKLLSVQRRSAELGNDDGPSMTLRLPNPPEARRGRPEDVPRAAAPTAPARNARRPVNARSPRPVQPAAMPRAPRGVPRPAGTIRQGTTR
jgi:general secretion pathway protein C